MLLLLLSSWLLPLPWCYLFVIHLFWHPNKAFTSRIFGPLKHDEDKQSCLFACSSNWHQALDEMSCFASRLASHLASSGWSYVGRGKRGIALVKPSQLVGADLRMTIMIIHNYRNNQRRLGATQQTFRQDKQNTQITPTTPTLTTTPAESD